MTNFNIGLTALRTAQVALDVVSNNVANANTPGYHRRRVELANLNPNVVAGHRIGNGVEVNYIRRLHDQVTESTLTSVISDVSYVEASLNIENKIESTLLAGDNVIGDTLNQLLSEFTNLSSGPNEATQRQAVLESGQQFAEAIRNTVSQLQDLKKTIRLQVDNEVENVNDELAQLSDLSVQISRFEARDLEHNNELDERDALLNRLAEMVGLVRSERQDGTLSLMIGRHSVQQGVNENSIRVGGSPEQLEIYMDERQTPLTLDNGRIGALLTAYNETIPAFEEKLNELANGLINTMNQVHGTGVGPDGGFQNLIGNIVSDSSTDPLSTVIEHADLQAGEFTIGVTDANGVRQLHTITIDPDVESLDDVAAQISGLSGLSASVSAATNQLQISALPGLSFDFAGGVDTEPDLSSVTGTSVAQLGGTYDGDSNETYTFRVDGSGTIGRGTGLIVNVFDSVGEPVAQLNVGEGYEAGSPIELPNGTTVAFSAGTLNHADEFSSTFVGDPDQVGLTSGLQLNSFFSGVDASTIEVDSKLLDNPTRLAAGKTGDLSDTSNLPAFIAIRDATVMPGDRTFSEYLDEIATEIGFQVQSNTRLNESLTTYKLRLEEERDATSAVDLNEEIVYLQQYQKSYEAAVRIIQTTDNMLNELFSIIR
ncbi:flagellar hook-associated protein FlgK [Roseiconus lacunae]|uniref:flagellar hook-associated protein FlgK n=1 Tax=Roseiconus lacunae TaxID=2605694 RepID=UPI001E471995|nr:flagellar hook-associated protein FlgK [Roseiconus lacunae]MCD0459453.1 flagellar hook-associated protein FlgK [Roseiconus lacunae]